ncbi:MAG: beta-galactosidase, partial [Mucilaginibacter sp.]
MQKLKYIIASLLMLWITGAVAQTGRHIFQLADSAFLLDGKPFQIISGEMHYTRIPRQAWRARMKMAKA